MEPLCQGAGYQLAVSSNDTAKQEMAGIEHLVARQVDGLFVVPCIAESEKYLKWSRRLPLVLFDRRVEGLPYVISDAEHAVTTMLNDALTQG